MSTRRALYQAIHMTSCGTLLVIPSVAVRPGRGKAFALPRRFVAGMDRYAALWPGTVRLLTWRDRGSALELDWDEFAPEEHDFELVVGERLEEAVAGSLDSVAAALIALEPDCLGAIHLCHAGRIPVVLVSTKSLRTRLQIVRAGSRNPIRLRRYWWEWNLERQFRREVRLAAGIQCNGLPTYAAYHELNDQTLLYFDNRISKDLLATPEEVRQRTSHLLERKPLRLVFSGRLLPIKGVDHIPDVIAELGRQGVDCRFDVFGDGPLASALRARSEALGVSNKLHLRGTLHHSKELVPILKQEADLFVCTHRQGDPSHTYLDMMGCGVPIAGYANEALRGLVERTGLNWCTPVDDPRRLAAKVAELDQDREMLAEHSVGVLGFAAENRFELNMERRVEHLFTCARLSPTRAPLPGR